MKHTGAEPQPQLQPQPQPQPASEIAPVIVPTPTTTPKPKWLKLSAAGQKAKRVLISDLRDASITFQCWRDRHSLGSSQLRRDCGQVLAEDEKTVVAKLTYNGRVWSPGGKLLMEAVKPEPAKAADPGVVKERLATCAKALHEYWETQRLLEREMGFTVTDMDDFLVDNFVLADVQTAEDVGDDVLTLWMDYATENREWEAL